MATAVDDLFQRGVQHPRLVGFAFPDDIDGTICTTFDQRCRESRDSVARAERAISGLRSLRLTPKVIVGQSFGSWTAAYAAERLRLPLILDSPFTLSGTTFSNELRLQMSLREVNLVQTLARHWNISGIKTRELLFKFVANGGLLAAARLYERGGAAEIFGGLVTIPGPPTELTAIQPRYQAEVCGYPWTGRSHVDPADSLFELLILRASPTCAKRAVPPIGPIRGIAKCARSDVRQPAAWCHSAQRLGISIVTVETSKHTGLVDSDDFAIV